MASLSVELVDGRSPRVAPLWRRLEAAARPAYFLTWGWIEQWLTMLPHAPTLALIFDGGAPIAAGWLAHRRVLRRHLLPTRAMFLNTSGVPRYDELTIEHNGLLAAAPVSLAAFARALPADWDELELPGIDRDAFTDLDDLAGFRVAIDREVASPLVDLERVRASGYLALLHPNTRAQIRRARRAVGELDVEIARDLGRAFAIYDELVELHGASWRARGQPGAFADPWFDAFHRGLIARRFAHGEIELVRVSSRGRTIGCLYNLVASGRVLFYQSGFVPHADPHVKPGYLCHAAAIEQAAAAGHAVYDFLGGDARYKKCLATGETRLVWLRVQRPLARFALEASVRRWIDLSRARRSTTMNG